jgi:glyoxylase-like metal-dependent hydrolase (beta-lactamase superfamily II)
MSSYSHLVQATVARTRVGSLTVTTLYDGALPIFSADMHGEPPERITELLAEGFLPPEGDQETAVNVFLVETGGRLVMIDAGAGTSLGPGTGHLIESLQSAGVEPAGVDDVLITHLHPDHAFGLVDAVGRPAFVNATVHVAAAEAGHWLDAAATASAEGVRRQIHDWAAAALAPYAATGRLRSFEYGRQPVPGVTAVDLHGHTPGHAGYLLDAVDERVLFWGDTVHAPAVQLRAPHVAMEIDSDRAQARTARRDILDRAVRERLLVGGAHLPFPGLGHLAHRHDEYIWAPVTYRGLP